MSLLLLCDWLQKRFPVIVLRPCLFFNATSHKKNKLITAIEFQILNPLDLLTCIEVSKKILK